MYTTQMTRSLSEVMRNIQNTDTGTHRVEFHTLERYVFNNHAVIMNLKRQDWVREHVCGQASHGYFVHYVTPSDSAWRWQWPGSSSWCYSASSRLHRWAQSRDLTRRRRQVCRSSEINDWKREVPQHTCTEEKHETFCPFCITDQSHFKNTGILHYNGKTWWAQQKYSDRQALQPC